MTRQSRYVVGIVGALVLGLGLFALLDRTAFFGGHGRAVDALIARNITARGGAEAWNSLESLRLTGQMDIGHGMYVPYVLEQKRPGKMCLEFVFNNEKAVQCVDGDSGWKRLPFMGRRKPEPMSQQELYELADAASIDGLLFNSAQRGYKVELLGEEMLDGRAAVKLQVTLPGGVNRWVYLDRETGLDIKRESTRVLRGEERLVETWYYDWQETDGVLIPRRQETQTEGEDETHFLTVDRVHGNPNIDDTKFRMPGSGGASS